MSFYTDLAPGDTLLIGGTLVTLEKKSGKRVRLKVEGDAKVQRVPQPQPAPQETPDGRGA
ncbi:MAG TPA: hypothetical protein PKZ27_02765 [Rhodocyclaceae bacterium]|nr:hypothetical protein [Burkholderiaceae bacterium]HRP74487.1 hypothetical protein [Rhodocyclaceae bacterium]